MNPKEIYYQNSAATIIKNLKKRQIEGYYCSSSKEALDLAVSFVNAGDTVSFGGSVTLSETGLIRVLRENKNITLLDRAAAATPEEVTSIYHKAFSADCYFMSTNAITLEGELVNIDGNGNRTAALIYGPKNVIILAGMNKVVPAITDAYQRVKNIAAPPNSNRLNLETPCAAGGFCCDCFQPNCMCSQTVITRRSGQPGRIKIILIGEVLGY